VNVHTARVNLAETLKTISGLRASAFVPPKIEPPMAVVGLGAGTYDDTLAGSMTADLSVLVLVSRADDRSAQARLDDYISPTGTYSVKATVDADPTLGGAVGSASVVSWADPGEFEVGGVSYVGVEFTVEAID
jgi:hypothetical protein